VEGGARLAASIAIKSNPFGLAWLLKDADAGARLFNHA
jgi:hypothetical protein